MRVILFDISLAGAQTISAIGEALAKAVVVVAAKRVKTARILVRMPAHLFVLLTSFVTDL
jgi:hypothetical protein